jgi:tripartite ATP-independent transporter DctP family solute receptor
MLKISRSKYIIKFVGCVNLKKSILVVLSAVLVLVIIAACSKKEEAPAASSATKAASSSVPTTSSKPSPAGKVKVMKLATANAKARSLTQGLYKFGELIEAATNGTIKVEVYPDAQLGGDLQVYEALKIGSVQGSTMSTGPIASFAKRFNLFDLPFLFKDTDTAYKIMDGEIGQDLLNDLPETGVIGLTYMENGFRDLTNNKREVKTMADIKGLKIRTLENKLHIALWKALDAVPTPLPFTELFTSLEQNVVDGQENPSGNVLLNKFYEVQKYLTKTGHVYNASPFIVSKKFWDELSDQEREAVKKAAKEATDWQRQANIKESNDSYAKLVEHGMTVTELSAEEKAKFVTALQPVYDKFKPEIGPALVDKLLNAAK